MSALPLDKLLKQTPDIVLVTTSEGSIVDANATALKQLGYRRSELLSLSLWDIDTDCYLRRHPELWLKATHGHLVHFQTHFARKNNQKIPVTIKLQHVINKAKQSFYIHFAENITEYLAKQAKLDDAKQSLERTRNRLENSIQQRTVELQHQIRDRERAEKDVNRMRLLLKNMIDSMPSIIIAVDMRARITQWNRQAEQFTGIEESQALGQTLAHLLPELTEQIDEVRAQLPKGMVQHGQRIHARLGDKHYLWDVVIYPLRASGAKGLVIRVDDVTERVRMETMLVQTEKMLSLGGLAAGMAHEINNPLGAILQSIQNIQRRLSPTREQNQVVAEACGLDLIALNTYLDQQKILRFIDNMQESGLRAAHIVADMLSFARPSAGKLTPVDLIQVLEDAVRLATSDYNQKKMFETKKIIVLRDYAPDIKPIAAQPNALKQVFLNLLMNAAQAMADSAECVEPTISLSIKAESDCARIEVIDNGPGMKESVLRRVFEPFFTTKEEGTGTGLGLSVSYFIITKQFSGTMEVASTPGQGSQFTLRLPFIPEPTLKTPPTPLFKVKTL